MKDVHFDAFISYRHSELDAFVAENLHKKLESFKLPKPLRDKAAGGRTRISRVFRDVDELPLSENLSDQIKQALDNSDYLITICTPRYLESKWCMKEIELFLRTHERDHVLVVLAEDEPCNSFPEILTFKEVEYTDEDGNTVIWRKEIEPLAADARGNSKKEIRKALDTVVLRLCAAIFGFDFEDLRQRRREAGMRRKAAFFGGIAAVLLVFALIVTSMLFKINRQNELIEEQYAALQEKYAGSMALAAEKLAASGRRRDAVYALRSVLPDDPEKGYSPDALRELYAVMNVYGVSDSCMPVNAYDTQAEIYEFSVSPENRYILLNDLFNIYVYDLESSETAAVIERRHKQAEDIFEASFCGPDALMVCDGDDIYRCSLADGSKKTVKVPGDIGEFFPSDDGEITLYYSDDIIYGIDEECNITYSIDISEKFGESYLDLVRVCFEDGTFAAFFLDSFDHYIIVADEKTGSVSRMYHDNGGYELYAAMKDHTIYYTPVDYDFTASASVYSVDLDNKGAGWIADIKDAVVERILPADTLVYVCEAGTIYALSKKSGSLVCMYNSDMAMAECWTEGDTLYYVLRDGRIFSCDAETNYEITEAFYSIIPEGYFDEVCRVGDDLFMHFQNANYLVRYAAESGSLAKAVDPCRDYYPEMAETADYDIEDIEGVNPALMEEAIYSDDMSYIYVSYTDYTAQIIDAESRKVIKNLQQEETEYESFKYYKAAEGYILSSRYYSYFFDDDFNIISKTESVVDEKGKKLLFCNNIWEYREVPFIPADELLELADEYLDGYEPPEWVKGKYSIQ